jgi:hypothetical protein
MRCRVLPAGDYDSKDRELGDTCIITDITPPILPGINDEWKPIRSKRSHPMIRALAKMFFPKDKGLWVMGDWLSRISLPITHTHNPNRLFEIDIIPSSGLYSGHDRTV